MILTLCLLVFEICERLCDKFRLIITNSTIESSDEQSAAEVVFPAEYCVIGGRRRGCDIRLS